MSLRGAERRSNLVINSEIAAPLNKLVARNDAEETTVKR